VTLIVLAGAEWTLRRRATSYPPEYHYTRKRVRNRQPSYVTLCDRNLGSSVEDAPSDVETNQVCHRCWSRAMALSAAEARAKATEIWAGSGAGLAKQTKRGNRLVLKPSPRGAT
jgi:hypothetical protein